jgi:hypothetical protein
MAVELRRAGVDYPTIAQQMQLSGPGQAYKIVQRALKRSIQEPADDVRALELSRLDTMHQGLWPRAKDGDTFSVDRVLKIQERRAKYLGLDAPEKHDVAVDVVERKYVGVDLSKVGTAPTDD